jgi:hypothetical protein
MSFFFFLGALVAFVAGIWLLVLAFRAHILWGLGSLFVPFVSLIFVIMYWRRAWIPFVVSLAGAGMMVIGLLSSLPSAESVQDLAAVQAELGRRVELGQMSEQDAARELFRMSRAMLLGEEYKPKLPPVEARPRELAEEGPSMPVSHEPEEPLQAVVSEESYEPEEPEEPERTRYLVQEYQPIDFSQASGLVGRQARVRMRSGLVREGILGDPSPRFLTLVHRVPGGDISYHIEPAKAASIEVLAWVERWE